MIHEIEAPGRRFSLYLAAPDIGSLLVKGGSDYIADRSGILAKIDSPSIPTLEAMGGTGDTVTGIAAALIAASIPVPEAAEKAARINRLAGQLAMPTPASQVTAVIDCIGRAVTEVMKG